MNPSSETVPPRAVRPVESRAARRERLLLLCAVDRARLRLLWRVPARSNSGAGSLLGGVLGPAALAAALPWVPGRIGRWSRRLRTGLGLAGLFRAAVRAAT